jgi:predicted GNAT family acetyltransferase
MHNIQLHLNEHLRGAFYIEENGEKLAEMVIGIKGTDLVVYHTEVSSALAGQGVAKQMLDTMVAYAREHKYKVIPLCMFVLGQFKRHEELYADVWKKTEEDE